MTSSPGGVPDADLEPAIREEMERLQLPGRIGGLTVGPSSLRLVLEVDAGLGTAAEALRRSVEAMLARLGGGRSATVIMTAQRPAPGTGRRAAAPPLPGVRHLLAVGSGKGGVGKSTAAVNLALAFAANGLRAGLLDADIYGPSLPRMLNIDAPPEVTPDKRIVPHLVHGLPVMSMGFLVPEDKATIWRGAMVHGALQQMLRQVAWDYHGPLDVLVMDLPPGTGDAQLTLAQQAPLSGAVIVSTPQDIALIDARKALLSFQRLDVPVLGIVENMSYYRCPCCDHRANIFGHGGAAAEAARLGIPLLAEIPLDIRIRETGDAGLPIVAQEPEGAHAEAFRHAARLLAARMDA